MLPFRSRWYWDSQQWCGGGESALPVSGKPVWPIEEKKVERGTVPGEWYSPTQPIPTKPPAYARNGISLDDLIDFTPELHDQAVTQIARYKIGPVFTPPVESKEDGPIATLTLGTASGGTNWPGGSYDPETHTVYVYACNSCATPISLLPAPPEVSDMRYVSGTAGRPVRMMAGPGENAGADSPLPTRTAGGRGGRGAATDGGGATATASGGTAAAATADGAATSAAPANSAPGAGAGRGGRGSGATVGGGTSVQGLPIVKPPYSTISAIKLDSGEIRWQIPAGETPDNIRNHPALQGLSIPGTGQSGYNIGTLVTKTLVIAGDGQVTTTDQHPRGAMLRAYDKENGKEVGAVWMPAPQSGSPMTYLWQGRQYIVVAVSGGAYSGEYIAYRLPENR